MKYLVLALTGVTILVLLIALVFSRDQHCPVNRAGIVDNQLLFASAGGGSDLIYLSRIDLNTSQLDQQIFRPGIKLYITGIAASNKRIYFSGVPSESFSDVKAGLYAYDPVSKSIELLVEYMPGEDFRALQFIESDAGPLLLMFGDSRIVCYNIGTKSHEDIEVSASTWIRWSVSSQGDAIGISDWDKKCYLFSLSEMRVRTEETNFVTVASFDAEDFTFLQNRSGELLKYDYTDLKSVTRYREKLWGKDSSNLIAHGKQMSPDVVLLLCPDERSGEVRYILVNPQCIEQIAVAPGFYADTVELSPDLFNSIFP